MPTLASYDELPYDSLPLPETRPDFLAALARLGGFDAPDPTCARILELGCAQGGNLVPMAGAWPASECVGVELSRVEAEAGAAFVARAGLTNCRILHADLAALPPDLGTFDYIITHGVFSWVPPAVQDALLAVCRRHLAENGVAYVSFNVEAGWKPLQPLRAALRERTSPAVAAPERCRQARAVLDELASDPSAAPLAKEIAYLRQAAPSYLFHEYLAEFNQPLTFDAFNARIAAHGLRYLGEAGPRRAVVELEDDYGLIPESMAARWLDAEAALDVALGTRFRRALLTRDDAPCPHPPRADALATLAFHADLGSDAEIDLSSDSEQSFRNPAGNTFPVTLPAMKAALMVLSAAYPHALDYATLRRAARALLAAHGGRDASDADFDGALFALVMLHGVMPTVWRGTFADEPGETPRATPLARLQATTPGWVVSGARGVAIDLDAAGRALLAAADGSRTVAALATWMHGELARAGLDAPPDAVLARTWETLWLFVRQGLLCPQPAQASAGLARDG
jgi:SAM-dependent methyltransferase